MTVTIGPAGRSYTLPVNSFTNAASGTVISPSDANASHIDLASGINTALAYAQIDGQRRVIGTQASTATPPVSPSDGQVWLVATGGIGVFSGKDKKYAAYVAASWTFFDPSPGDMAIVVSTRQGYIYDAAGVWQAGNALAGGNSDITSLAGLTTPLSVAQGGTSGNTQATARAGIGAAASGANTDITSLGGLSTPLSIAQGGTGAATPLLARTGLGLDEVFLEDYGGAGNGTTDCTPAFNAILAAGKGTIRLRSRSIYKMATAVNTIPYPLRIIGDGMSSSVLKFYQSSGNAFLLTGTVDAGGVMVGFTVQLAGGAITAYLYLLSAAGGAAPDFFVARDLNLTGATTSDVASYGVMLDGNARTSGVVGIRNVTLENLKIFNCNFRGFETRYARDCELHRVSVFATGTGGTDACAVTGASGTQKSFNTRLSACAMGNLSVDFADGLIGHGNTASAVTYSTNTTGANLGGRATSVANNNGALNLTTGWLV